MIPRFLSLLLTQQLLSIPQATLFDQDGERGLLAWVRARCYLAVQRYVEHMARQLPSRLFGTVEQGAGSVELHIEWGWANINQGADNNAPHTHPGGFIVCCTRVP